MCVCFKASLLTYMRMAVSSSSLGESNQKVWSTSRFSRQWCVKPARPGLTINRLQEGQRTPRPQIPDPERTLIDGSSPDSVGLYLTIQAVRVIPAHSLTTSYGLVSWGSEIPRVQCSAHCDASVLHAHFHQSCAGLWDAGCHCPHRDHPSCYQGLLSWEAWPHSLYKVRANAERTLHLQMSVDTEDRN